MAATENDVDRFVSAIAAHAAQLKTLVGEAKALDDYYVNLDLSTVITANPAWVKAPLDDVDVTSYVNLMRSLQDFMDNVAVPAGARRQIKERVGSSPLGGKMRL